MIKRLLQKLLGSVQHSKQRNHRYSSSNRKQQYSRHSSSDRGYGRNNQGQGYYKKRSRSSS
ncbi:hypothetical protein [Paenibacillus antarcticus]|uniref:hypothetical protein n=1 Tax=Paenibacillus antarcticus TaxID=253703 RepID=UPI000A99B7E0|nr:hypothetical protein [Paenibacillus antarcticus]